MSWETLLTQYRSAPAQEMAQRIYDALLIRPVRVEKMWELRQLMIGPNPMVDLILGNPKPVEREERLGSGRYGRVYRSGPKQALKISSHQDGYVNHGVLREIDFYSRHSHPHLIQAQNVWIDISLNYYLTLERYPTDLHHLQHKMNLKERLKILPKLSYALMAQIGYLAQMGMVNSDVKPANILVGLRPFQVRLADWNLCRQIGQPFLACTEWFWDPEMKKGEPTTPTVDLYAACCSLIYFTTGRYQTSQEGWIRLIDGWKFRIPNSVYTLLRSGISPRSTRPNLDTILARCQIQLEKGGRIKLFPPPTKCPVPDQMMVQVHSFLWDLADQLRVRPAVVATAFHIWNDYCAQRVQTDLASAQLTAVVALLLSVRYHNFDFPSIESVCSRLSLSRREVRHRTISVLRSLQHCLYRRPVPIDTSHLRELTRSPF